MQIKTNEFQKELKEHGDFYFPFLVSKEQLSLYTSGTFLWHWHSEIELTFVTRGQMLYSVNQTSFLLREGQALFVNSACLHTGTMQNTEDCEYTSVTFDPKLIYGYDNSKVYLTYMKPILQNPTMPAVHFDKSLYWHHDAISLIEEILKLDKDRASAYELDIYSCLSRFWKLLFLNTKPGFDPLASDKNKYGRICDMVSYIEKHYHEPITLKDIGQAIHLCPSECSRLFKKYMKLTLFDFIARYRIEKSKHYLLHTSFTMTEIAHLVGYRDSNYYSKAFHKITGSTPRDYRSRSSR